MDLKKSKRNLEPYDVFKVKWLGFHVIQPNPFFLFLFFNCGTQKMNTIRWISGETKTQPGIKFEPLILHGYEDICVEGRHLDPHFFTSVGPYTKIRTIDPLWQA